VLRVLVHVGVLVVSDVSVDERVVTFEDDVFVRVVNRSVVVDHLVTVVMFVIAVVDDKEGVDDVSVEVLIVGTVEVCRDTTVVDVEAAVAELNNSVSLDKVEGVDFKSVVVFVDVLGIVVVSVGRVTAVVDVEDGVDSVGVVVEVMVDVGGLSVMPAPTFPHFVVTGLEVVLTTTTLCFFALCPFLIIPFLGIDVVVLCFLVRFDGIVDVVLFVVDVSVSVEPCSTTVVFESFGNDVA